MALITAFLVAENENRQLEDLPQADFGRVPERFLRPIRTKPITCILKITLIVCSCSVSTQFFILSLSPNALYDFYSEIVDLFIFIH